MAVHSLVPDDAITADLLGTERHSHAVQVTPEGLLLTVGYSVMEASEVWLTNRRGQTAEAIILAHDYDSGIALLKPTVALGSAYFETTTLDTLHGGDQMQVIAANDKQSHPVELASIQEFAGRWEYVLDRALYTLPLFDRWSGAALLNAEGKLCGIGSLALGIRAQNQEIAAGNLFIPVELVMPHLQHMQEHGQKPGTLRPWLGALIEEQDSEIYVVGIYNDAPAAKAGMQPGDIIISVDRQPVHSMAGFFRTIWHYGPAGTSIPITISDGKDTREVVLDTTDRDSFFIHHLSNMIN